MALFNVAQAIDKHKVFYKIIIKKLSKDSDLERETFIYMKMYVYVLTLFNSFAGLQW